MKAKAMLRMAKRIIRGKGPFINKIFLPKTFSEGRKRLRASADSVKGAKREVNTHGSEGE